MYWCAYITNAHRYGFGFDVFVSDAYFVKKDSLHIELMIWNKVLNLSIGRKAK